MPAGARVAAALLPHVNLLLAMLYGAGLATAARLKWDPSTYIAVREVLPVEYRVAGVALCAAALLLLLLTHVAAAALSAAAARPPPTVARALLLTYAACMAAMMVAEVAFCWWAAVRVRAWLHSEQAQVLRDALQLREDVRALLRFMGRWHPLPDKINDLIEEAEADLPRNAYCACALGALAALLQPAAALLALLAARRARPAPPHCAASSAEHALIYRGATPTIPRPVKSVYSNGRLHIV